MRRGREQREGYQFRPRFASMQRPQTSAASSVEVGVGSLTKRPRVAVQRPAAAVRSPPSQTVLPPAGGRVAPPPPAVSITVPHAIPSTSPAAAAPLPPLAHADAYSSSMMAQVGMQDGSLSMPSLGIDSAQPWGHEASVGAMDPFIDFGPQSRDVSMSAVFFSNSRIGFDNSSRPSSLPQILSPPSQVPPPLTQPNPPRLPTQLQPLPLSHDSDDLGRSKALSQQQSIASTTTTTTTAAAAVAAAAATALAPAAAAAAAAESLADSIFLVNSTSTSLLAGPASLSTVPAPGSPRADMVRSTSEALLGKYGRQMVCLLCGATVPEELYMSSHALACAAICPTSTVGEEQQFCMLRATAAAHERMWTLVFEAPMGSSLLELDYFLRAMWTECSCGHESQFCGEAIAPPPSDDVDPPALRRVPPLLSEIFVPEDRPQLQYSFQELEIDLTVLYVRRGRGLRPEYLTRKLMPALLLAYGDNLPYEYMQPIAPPIVLLGRSRPSELSSLLGQLNRADEELHKDESAQPPAAPIHGGELGSARRLRRAHLPNSPRVLRCTYEGGFEIPYGYPLTYARCQELRLLNLNDWPIVY
jgi:hypothetical protein